MAVATMGAQRDGLKKDRLLGQSEIFNNDYLGDQKDRWRTGSIASSFTFGKDPREVSNVRALETMEYRLRFEMITPHNLQAGPSDQERPYVGAVALGIFSHMKQEKTEIVAGGELVFIGPRNGVSSFQTAAHDRLGIPGVGPELANSQLGNKVIPTAFVSVAPTQTDTMGSSFLRPFAEAQVGAETFLRAGVDAIFAPSKDRVLYVRDVVTGHLVPHLHSKKFTGTTVVIGGDVALVADSQYLPENRGYIHKRKRTRVRAGVHQQWDKFGMFYGLTVLGKEFEGQPETQRLGSLELSLKFKAEKSAGLLDSACVALISRPSRILRDHIGVCGPCEGLPVAPAILQRGKESIFRNERTQHDKTYCCQI